MSNSTSASAPSSSDSPPSSSPPPSSPPPSPPEESDSSPPPPPPEESDSPTPPTPSDESSSSPPPPSGSSSSSKSPPSSDKFLPPPPPPQGKTKSTSSTPALEPPPSKDKDDSSTAPSKHRKSPSSNDDDSGGGSRDQLQLPIIIGVAAGIAVFVLIVLISALVCCCKKKKKHKMHYYDPGEKGNNNYYDNGGGYPPKWQPQPVNKNPRPPPGNLQGPPGKGGGGWGAPPPPPPPGVMNSSDMGSTFSSPHGPPMPPPSPGLSLMGFNKSTFTYEELQAATGGFSQANILGQGGFGYVYKGYLPNGKEVAVKQLKSGSGQGEREFQAEVEIISRVHHRHLVSLVGYCIAGAQRLLVYEFVPNNTLEHHLHAKGLSPLDWPTRVKIAVGSAKGFAYLHEDCHPKIIHRDIKAANILLDYKFEAMVADFGLAKLSSDNYTHVSTRIMGTFGYLAPEYASSGKLTDKSDVFSFGVMLLELITGRRPIDHTCMDDSLVDWARPICTEALGEGKFDELADPRLEGKYNTLEMATMVSCAAASVRHSARRRPKMSQVVRALEGESSLDDLHDGVKPGQSINFNSSSEHELTSYSAKMRQFRKMALGATTTDEFSGNYTGVTSEYGLNPSESSSSSGECTDGVRKHHPQP